MATIDPLVGEFRGQIDEFRVWRVARTADQVRNAMFQRLTGREEGLVGLWNFDDGKADDASPAGHHGKLVGQARAVAAELPTPDQLPLHVVIKFQIDYGQATPVANTIVRLSTRGWARNWLAPKDSNALTVAVLDPGLPYELAVCNRKQAALLTDLRFDLGQTPSVVVKLEDVRQAPAGQAAVLGGLFQEMGSTDPRTRPTWAFRRLGLPQPWSSEFLQWHEASALLFATLTLPFAVLHLFLFAFYPRQRSNLHYAVFTACAGLSGSSYSMSLPLPSPILDAISFALAFLTAVLGLRLLYSLFRETVPRRWFSYLAAWAVAAMLWVLGAMGLLPFDGPAYWGGSSLANVLALAFYGLLFGETIAALACAIWQRRPGARLV